MPTRFLIVDDSELVRRAVRTVLRTKPGWEVCGEAPDGTAALAMFKELQPDIVLLDFQMPGMNGIDAAEQMAKIAPDVPVVLFTQHASPELERHALEVGVRSVVSKTNSFSMIGIIEKLLSERHSQRRPGADAKSDTAGCE